MVSKKGLHLISVPESFQIWSSIFELGGGRRQCPPGPPRLLRLWTQ